MAKNIPAAIKEKYNVSPAMPNKFNYRTVDYVTENLSLEQADMLAADENFEFIKPKKEKAPKNKAE